MPPTPIGGSKPAKAERRQRAQQFLKDALAHGPKQVSDVEEAAQKAHIDPHTLGQARADLGVVVTRGNAGGVQASSSERTSSRSARLPSSYRNQLR